MYIEELVLDGFKSYAVRTVLGPFDRQFNAITGLNGSGKSNVLDGICFVLGISNLSKVRAVNLSELVYKQGQAGITKATVTIVFNNLDKSRSPVGFEEFDVITVGRQVVIGGRNRYFINSKSSQLQDVYNLFHSVQLNINNPHFLIMQGSITKVINMKPPEILGMIEEAAGTGMYESKKTVALRTIEKKQLKVDEIDRIIKDEVGPQMEKLKKEKSFFLEWSSLVQKSDEVERTTVSWEYRNVLGKLEGGGGQFDQAQTDLEKWRETQKILKLSLSKSDEKSKSDIKLLEKQKAQQSEVEAKFEEELRLTKRKLVEVETNIKEKSATLKSNTGKQLKSKSSEQKLVKLIEERRELLEEKERLLATSKESGLEQIDSESKLKQQALADLEAGSEGNVVLQSELRAKKTQLDRCNTELKTLGIKEKGLRDRLHTLKAGSKKNTQSSAEYALFDEERKELMLQKSALEDKIKETSFNPNRYAELCDLIKSNERKIEELSEHRNSTTATVNNRLDMAAQVDFSNPGVKGMLARLFGIKPEHEKYLSSLELLLGAKVFNIVVDNEQTSKQILASGKLKKRVTFLPLNKIQGKKIQDNQVKEALRVGKDLRGEILPAIEAVYFREDLVGAMEYAFGTNFLCDSSEIGKRATFNENLPAQAQFRTVTVDGDVFDPKGSLSGGSPAPVGKNNRVLEGVFSLQKIVFELEEIQSETAKLQGEKSRMNVAKDAYERLGKELGKCMHNISIVDAKLKGTAQSQVQSEIDQVEQELTEVKERQTRLSDVEIKLLVEDVGKLETEIGSYLKNKESKVKELQREVAELKKAKKKAVDAVRELELEVEQCVIALKTTEEEWKSFQEDAVTQASVNSTLETEIHSLEETAHLLRDQCDTLGSKLKEAKITKKSFETAILDVLESVKSLRAQLDEADVQVTKLDALVQSLSRDKKEAKAEVERLEKEFAWLRSEKGKIMEKEEIGKISKSEIEKIKAKLSDLKDEVVIKGKSINKRIIPLVDRCEKDADELLSKRAALEAEKKQINEFILDLDDKKGRALSRTWQIVNSNLGAIFRSLLPKVDAKLAPPEGMTALEGLELKVQFGSVWKDSLTELSGGQKSLLALSLVLALLLFKPAPFYILDEVDAALDVSHTRNIGKMIKQYFPHSQFVIVSLKDGMFNNANVLFRVRFENGTSVVSRTAQVTAEVTDAPELDIRENIPIEEYAPAVNVKSARKIGTKKKSAKKIVQESSDEDVVVDSESSVASKPAKKSKSSSSSAEPAVSIPRPKRGAKA